MPLQKIPYGISNYRMIREEGYVYVDKTRFIRVLEGYPEPYVFFLRPRRFGKSLFVSLLSSYYDIAAKDEFEHLFSGTDIGKNPTPMKNNYYVLNFDFSGISTESEDILRETFAKSVLKSVNTFIEKYCPQCSPIGMDFAPELLQSFIHIIEREINGPIYVIIDEYDHFANELLSFDLALFQNSVSKNGFIRKWYEVLKQGTKTSVRRIFATGVSPVTLDSLTSGFNIGKNLSRSQKLNEMMGFTAEEVSWLVTETLPAGSRTPAMMGTMQQYYNGYLFSEKGEKRVFNSDMILYYLSSTYEQGEPPELLLDMNIASDYGKLGRIMRLKSPESNIPVLKEIVYGGEVSAQITPQFSMEKDFTRDDFASLLYYLGLLTIKKAIPGEVVLHIPNYVIRGLYYDFFAKVISEEGSFAIQPERIRDAMREIGYEGRCAKLVVLIEEILHAFSNRDYIGFDEKYIKVLLFTYAHMSNLYLVKSEYEVPDGYIDIVLIPREPWKPDYCAMFELKYLKSGASEDKIRELTQEGIGQLKRYSASSEFSHIKNLKKWVLVFVGDRCVGTFEG